MPTPVENAVANVNDSSLNRLFQAVANNTQALESLSQSNRNIDAVASNVSAVSGLGNNGGQDEGIRLCLTRRTGRDPANFPSTADTVTDDTFRNEIFADSTLSALLSQSNPGMAEVVSSTTFSSEMAASQTAMQQVALGQPAMQQVAASQTAMQEVAASQTALDEVIPSQVGRDNIYASQVAMQEVAASQAAMNKVVATDASAQDLVASQTALDEVFITDTAADAMANSTVVMDRVAESRAALDAILAAPESIMANTVADSSTTFQSLRDSNFTEEGRMFFNDMRSFSNVNVDNIPNGRHIVHRISQPIGNLGFGGVGVGDIFDTNRVFIGNIDPNTGNNGGSGDIKYFYVD